MAERFRVAQKVLMFDGKGRVLIVRFARLERFAKKMWGKWDFPGGKVEFGESLEEGLAREVAEEVGEIEYEVGEPRLVWDWLVAHDPSTRVVCVGYEARYLAGEIVSNEEHDKYGWVEVGELEDYAWGVGERRLLGEIKERYGSA